RVLLQVAAESVEAGRPEPGEGGHPLAHPVEALGGGGGAGLAPLALLAHPPDAPRHRGGRRHPRAAPRHRRRAHGDPPFAGGELGDERAPHRMGDGAEGVGDGRRAGGGHAWSIRKENLTCQESSSARTSPMILVASCGLSGSPPSASAVSLAKSSTACTPPISTCRNASPAASGSSSASTAGPTSCFGDSAT